MVKKNGELKVARMEHFKGGEGALTMEHFIDGPEGLYGKGRVFSRSTLEPGCSIGWHVHEGDGEFFYILSGTGEYNDNGTVVPVGPGDLLFCGDGEGHELVNTGAEPLVDIALVIYS